MSTRELPVDVDVLRSEIEKTYTEVSAEQGTDFIFPTGRAWAQELGYPEPELSRIPDETVESFAGVANPWVHGSVGSGQTVLDLRCGDSTDLLIAAQILGHGGRDIGIDMINSKFPWSRERSSAIGVEKIDLHP